jgi:type IV secretory pathway TraG/TraD family ATPase VirD4
LKLLLQILVPPLCLFLVFGLPFDSAFFYAGLLSEYAITYAALQNSGILWNKTLGALVPILHAQSTSLLSVSQFLWSVMGISYAVIFFRKVPRKPAPSGGIYLGKTTQGKPFHLNEQNLSYHVEIVAPSGSGKTNLLQNLIQQRIESGHGIIFIDLKAEFSLMSWVYSVSCAANRKESFRLVSLADPHLSVPYNPIQSGTAQEIHSQLMNSLTWSEDFYRKIASLALQTIIYALCTYRDATHQRFHIGHVLQLLEDRSSIEVLLSKLTELQLKEAATRLEHLAQLLKKPGERDKLVGLIAGLSAMVNCSAGSLLTDRNKDNSYELKDAIGNARITYFSINSLKLRESATVFAKLLLQDLMKFVGETYATSEVRNPTTVIIDEFASFAMPEFIELMDRARGAGIGIVLAHQSRADLRAVSPEFQERIEANANTTIVSGVKSSEDADHYAGIIGTRTVDKETRRMDRYFLWNHDTGQRSSREAEEYILHPNRIKSLQQGEVLVINRTVCSQWGLVKVPLRHNPSELLAPPAPPPAPCSTPLMDLSGSTQPATPKEQHWGDILS